MKLTECWGKLTLKQTLKFGVISCGDSKPSSWRSGKAFPGKRGRINGTLKEACSWLTWWGKGRGRKATFVDRAAGPWLEREARWEKSRTQMLFKAIRHVKF